MARASTAASARPASRVGRVVARVGAAGVGGYALAATFAMAVPLLLPLERHDGVLAATLASFVVYAGAIVWVFSVQSARVAWAGLLTPSAAFLALWLVARGGGA